MTKICFISAGAPLHGRNMNKHFNKHSKKENSSYFHEWDKTFGYALVDPSKFDVLFSVGYFQTAGYLFRDIKMLHPRKKIINMWIGTDIINTKTLVDRGDLRSITLCNQFVDLHVADGENFIREVEVFFDMEAKFIPSVPEKVLNLKPLPEEFSIATYVHETKPEWYNYDLMVKVAREFKHVPFYIFARNVERPVDSPNITHLGFLEGKDKVSAMEEVSLFIRIAKHDSCSVFMIEFLQMGRYAINCLKFPHVFPAKNFENLIETIKKIKELKEPNKEGSEFYRKNYSPKKQVEKIEEVIK